MTDRAHSCYGGGGRYIHTLDYSQVTRISNGNVTISHGVDVPETDDLKDMTSVTTGVLNVSVHKENICAY